MTTPARATPTTEEREELLVGVSAMVIEGLTAYAEAAHAHEMRNEDLQQPGRLQAGFQYEPEPRWWGNRLRWYAAVDATATEERDWDMALSVQTGVALRAGPRVGRIGVHQFVLSDRVPPSFQAEIEVEVNAAHVDRARQRACAQNAA